MAIESEAGFISLADLAAMDTTEVATLMSRNPDAGIYLVVGKEIVASQSDPKEAGQAPLFSFQIACDILGADLLDKSKDTEKLVGRTLRERYTLWPTDFTEAIGLLKGRYQLVGLPNKGPLGGVPNQPPGWLDGMVNHRFRIRVRSYVDSKGNERVGFDWLKPEEEAGEQVAA